jgi:transcriptional regulator with XRE-family HTH domain
VGQEVEGVPRRPAVGAAAAPGPAEPDSFGPWLRQQRELRGISQGWLAARIKLSHARVQAIEERGLASDGQGRAAARALAGAIGADPEAAVALLGARRPGATAPIRTRLGLRLPVRALAVLLGVVLGVWLLAELLLLRAQTDGEARVVYRPDYVERLLGDPTGDAD